MQGFQGNSEQLLSNSFKRIVLVNIPNVTELQNTPNSYTIYFFSIYILKFFVYI